MIHKEEKNKSFTADFLRLPGGREIYMFCGSETAGISMRVSIPTAIIPGLEYAVMSWTALRKWQIMSSFFKKLVAFRNL